MSRQRIWIAGASTGLGAALARHYGRAGDELVLSARRAPLLEALAAELPGGSAVYPLDVTDGAAVARTVALIEAERGPLDLAILNAGTYEPMPAATFSAARSHDIMNLNYGGVVNALEALLPRFLARGRGRIAVTASLAGYVGLPYAGPYAASKSALIALCESLAPELAAAGVGLSVINPGFVRTPLTDRNDFEMPFLMDADVAAARIAEGLAAGRFEVRVPRRLAWMMRLLSWLPHPLFFAVTRRMLRDAP
jgi:short-subunit dehydrogenase